jgi:hypothetical protein
MLASTIGCRCVREMAENSVLIGKIATERGNARVRNDTLRSIAYRIPKPCAPVRVLVGGRGKEGQFTPDPAIRTRASVIAHAGALRFLLVRKAGSCQPLVQALHPGPDTSCLHRVLPSAPLALPRTRAPGPTGTRYYAKRPNPLFPQTGQMLQLYVFVMQLGTSPPLLVRSLLSTGGAKGVGHSCGDTNLPIDIMRWRDECGLLVIDR